MYENLTIEELMTRHEVATPKESAILVDSLPVGATYIGDDLWRGVDGNIYMVW